jgi:hypothetical protein
VSSPVDLVFERMPAGGSEMLAALALASLMPKNGWRAVPLRRIAERMRTPDAVARIALDLLADRGVVRRISTDAAGMAADLWVLEIERLRELPPLNLAGA